MMIRHYWRFWKNTFDKLGDSSLDYDIYFCADELYKYINSQKIRYDVYILDIEMKGMNGLELARYLRDQDSNSLIVF